jgi:hypothetical protein
MGHCYYTLYWPPEWELGVEINRQKTRQIIKPLTMKQNSNIWK